MSELEQRILLKADLWRANPLLVQMLGLSPVLAVSTTAVNGIGLGLATLLVLMLSSLTTFLLRQHINDTWRFVWYLVILSSYTTAVDILMQWLYFPLYRELGIYVPLIACNIALLMQLEKQRSETQVLTSLTGALRLGLGWVITLLLLSGLRELLANGTLLENWQLLMSAPSAETGLLGTDSQTMKSFTYIALQPGALIVLGLLVAAKNWLDYGRFSGDRSEPEKIQPVQRARVTGKL